MIEIASTIKNNFGNASLDSPFTDDFANPGGSSLVRPLADFASQVLVQRRGRDNCSPFTIIYDLRINILGRPENG